KAAARCSGFNSDTSRLVVGMVSPKPIPDPNAPRMASPQLSSVRAAVPDPMIRKPMIKVRREPQRGTSALDSVTPTIDAPNCAAKKYPDCASVNAHRPDKMG